MASAPRLLAINLGMQTVGAAEFRAAADGGLTLTAFTTVELIVDPAADAARAGQIEGAINEVRTALKLGKNEQASLTLPSQSVFSRFVRLPGASAQDVTEIIKFEAQQNVPFPIDEVVWDYQIMGEIRESNWDVGLVAIKADQLSEVVTAVSKSGVRPRTIDAAPVAIYNAFRYNYSEVSGCSLIVDIGARTTNLIFVEGQRLFSRTLPVGGNSISAAVAKEFKQDITLAERLKIEKGFVGLGGAYEEPPDPTVAKISKVVRNTMTRLHAEIARSISFYRQSQAGSAPVRAYLAGGTVGMQYMLEFFSEKLQIPVEHFNALRNVTVASQEVADAVAGHTHTLGELVGGALRAAGPCPVEINLRPPQLVKEQDIAKRKPFLVVAGVCVLAALAVWLAYFHTAAAITADKLAEVNSLVSGLEQVASQLDKLKAEKEQLEREAAPLLLAAAERAAWAEILDELGKSVPPRFVWVTRLTPLSGGRPVTIDGRVAATAAGPGGGAQPAGGGPTPPGQAQQETANAIDAIQLNGLYLADPPNNAGQGIVDQFVSRLEKSPVFKIEPNQRVVTMRTTPDGQSWAYSYTILLPLAQPIPLP